MGFSQWCLGSQLAFKRLHCFGLSTGLEHCLDFSAHYLDSLYISPSAFLKYFFEKMKAVLYVNSLLFMERKLTAMINEVKSPYPRADCMACIFQL